MGSAEIDGSTISAFVSVSNFRVGNQQVDASNAAFRRWHSRRDLTNGQRVEVRGNVVAGVLVATASIQAGAGCQHHRPGSGTSNPGSSASRPLAPIATSSARRSPSLPGATC